MKRIFLILLFLLLFTSVGFAQTLRSLSPTSTVVSTTSLTLIVNGGGFTGGSVVLWNGTALTTTFVSSSILSAVVPPNLMTQVGGVQITVFDTITSNPLVFQVLSPSAQVTSWTPTIFTLGVGLNLTVYGSGFSSNAVVYFDNTPVTTAFISTGILNATIPGFLVTAGRHSVRVINGQPAPANLVLLLTPQPVPFGNQQISLTSSGSTVTISNTGANTVTFSSFSIGGTNGAEFNISSNACGPSLATSASCTAVVTFTPAILGLRVGLFTVASDAVGSPQSLNLTGTGTPVPGTGVTLSLSTIQFPSTVITVTSSPITSTLTNVGSTNVSISAIAKTGTNAADYDISTSTCVGGVTVLTPTQHCDIITTFTPSTAFPENDADISITDTAPGSPHTISLNGNGIPSPAPGVTITPTSMAFGNWVTSTPSSPITVSVKNTGAANLVISAESSSNADFALTATACITTLTPGQTCPVTVIFTPSGTSTESANISLTDNAVGSPHLIPLSGMGVASGGAHFMALTWVASTSSGLVGYNVYRGSQSGGPYTLLTPTPINALAYTDNAVVSAQTYYYVITAVGTSPQYNPVESLDSTQVNGTIP